jgi:hypothetical protein
MFDAIKSHRFSKDFASSARQGMKKMNAFLNDLLNDWRSWSNLERSVVGFSVLFSLTGAVAGIS